MWWVVAFYLACSRSHLERRKKKWERPVLMALSMISRPLGADYSRAARLALEDVHRQPIPGDGGDRLGHVERATLATHAEAGV